MKLIITLIAVIAMAKATPVPVGSNPCTWGPSYWCKDLGAAQECGATQFCTEKVWSTPPRKASADPLCEICELVVATAKSAIGGNINPTSLEKELDQICNILPKTIQSECMALINQYVPDLVKEWDAATPETVCSLAKVCAAKAAQIAVKAGPTCALCEFAIKQIENTLGDNATQKEIIDAVEQVCNILPGTVKSECQQLVEQYGAQIIGYFVDQDPAEICSLLRLCNSSVRAKVAKVVVPAANTTCALCEFAISEVQQLIGNNATEQQILDALEQVCTILPSTIKDECDSLVSTYGKQILDMLMQEKPEALCSEIGLCDSILPYLLKGKVFLDPQL